MERDKAAQLLSGRFGRRVAPALVDQLLRRTGGDLELLAEICDQVNPDSDGLDRVPIQWPPARVEPIEIALAALGPVGREVLEAASVIGREFDLAILERVAVGHDVVSGLDEAVAAGLINPLPKQVYAFALATTKEVCYDGLGVRRRAQLHELTADALSALGAMSGNRAATLVELAHHTAEAAMLGGEHRLDRAVAASCAAGQVAGEEGLYDLAAEFFSQAALLAGRAGWDAGPAGRLLVAAGEARLHASVSQSAREVGRASLLGAMRLGRTAGDAGLIAAAALAFGPAPTLGALAPVDRACPVDTDRVDAWEEALRSDVDASTLARVRARLAAHTGEAETALRAYTEAHSTGDPRALAEALLAVVQTGAGIDGQSPDQLLARANREAEALGDLELLARAGDLSATVAVRAGARETALRRLATLAGITSGPLPPREAAHGPEASASSRSQRGEAAQAVTNRKATAFVRWYAARAAAEAARLAGQPDWAHLADAALAAGVAVDPAAARESDLVLRAADASQPRGSLTLREREVFDWALRGASSREIAEALVLGERTVETHLASIYRKLAVRSRLELIKQYGGGNST